MGTLRPGKPCNHPSCRNMIHSGGRFCELHTKQHEHEYDKRRGNANSRGYDKAWRQVRSIRLAIDPICTMCLSEDNRVTRATIVHHVKHVDTHPELRLELSNTVSVCKRHHDELHKGERWSPT